MIRTTLETARLRLRQFTFDKETGEVIGFCGIRYIEEIDLPEVGYRYLPQHWGIRDDALRPNPCRVEYEPKWTKPDVLGG